ncbi:MAG: DUF4275 family protein [Clostridia bacterium]|nr:DUF4275 family protein [Clostridia bacterium]
MFVKKATAAQIAEAKDAFAASFGEYTVVDDIPVKEYMIKWLRSFAPDMPVYDAKSFCLPRLMYRNYLWHAFSFQKTDCYLDDDAREAFEKGFAGPCFVLLNHENILLRVENGRVFNPENVAGFHDMIIFTEDFSETYVNTGKEEFGPYYKSETMAVIVEGDALEADELPEEPEDASEAE